MGGSGKKEIKPMMFITRCVLMMRITKKSSILTKLVDKSAKTNSITKLIIPPTKKLYQKAFHMITSMVLKGTSGIGNDDEEIEIRV